MIINKLKKIRLLKKIYNFFRKNQIVFLSIISPKIASRVFYKMVKGKKLNLKNPVLFNEKLMWLKINNYNKNKIVFKCVDKYEIRNYALSKGIDETNLPKLLKIYKNARDINFEDLPKEFVLKCTHGSGFNIICKDKDLLNKKETIKKLNKWLKLKYGYSSAETHYNHIKPVIICEEFMKGDRNILPNDYKIYCFDGVPLVTLVCSDRENGLKLDFYDVNWNQLKIGTKKYRSKELHKKPNQFNKMLEIAAKVSKGFPFVRVDFYEYNNKAILGEMTFTPAGCAAKYYTEEGEQYLGKMIKLNIDD